MSGIRKSTDAGLTNAERKSLRESEAQEAMSDHDDAEKAFHENRERLRKARLAREATAGPMLYPAPDLPDDTPIGNVHFSTRIRNAIDGGGRHRECDSRCDPAGNGGQPTPQGRSHDIGHNSGRTSRGKCRVYPGCAWPADAIARPAQLSPPSRMQDISCLVLPIPAHAFFKQAVLQGEIGHDLLQGGGLTTKVLHLAGRRGAGRVARIAAG